MRGNPVASILIQPERGIASSDCVRMTELSASPGDGSVSDQPEEDALSESDLQVALVSIPQLHGTRNLKRNLSLSGM